MLSWLTKPSFSYPVLLRRQSRSATPSRSRFQSLMRSDRKCLVAKKFVAGRIRYLYQAPIGYVGQPKQDNRGGQHFVSAEVQQGKLGIGSIFLLCQSPREYFYRLPGSVNPVAHPTLYEVLHIPATAELLRTSRGI